VKGIGMENALHLITQPFYFNQNGALTFDSADTFLICQPKTLMAQFLKPSPLWILWVWVRNRFDELQHRCTEPRTWAHFLCKPRRGFGFDGRTRP